MKFHVGDTVKIKEGLNVMDTENFEKEMGEYCGKVAKITKVNNSSYFLDIDEEVWYWNDHMLEPVQKEYRVIVNGNTITVKDDNGNEGEFNLSTEISFALKNMRWKPKKAESYYTVAFPYEFNIVRSTWRNDKTDNILYKKGLVFKTKKEAMDVAQKMLEAINNDWR